MTELEKVEKLREKADVSFQEAKEALDAANGDILDALIYLEANGKAVVPAGGGYFAGSGYYAGGGYYAEDGTNSTHSETGGNKSSNNSNNETFGDMLKRFGRFCLMLLRKGNSNYLEAAKNGEPVFSCPVTIVVLFLMFFFWVTIPLFVISLFCGLRYSFRGSDLGRDSVNKVMDSASDVVDEVKMSIQNTVSNEE